ncbi:MAG: triose-phosphate isomerase [Chloroflexi bacterium]|nr:triose-phosphate isomerase [Chloroflexota bacterium]
MVTSMVVGNWKMNTTVSSSVELARGIRNGISGENGPQVVVCPPFVSLVPVSEALRGSRIGVGAQNMHSETNGAYTGEISPEMLSQICRFVILGHSERRTYFAETDEFVNAKVLAAQSVGITPIICVGENLADRQAGRAGDVVTSQLEASLNGIKQDSDIIVAYEPVWAIGTGESASPEVAQEIMFQLRQALSTIVRDRSNEIPLLYGGSVNPSNIASYMAQQDIDGALVGGASLDADTFCLLVAQVDRSES